MERIMITLAAALALAGCQDEATNAASRGERAKALHEQKFLRECMQKLYRAEDIGQSCYEAIRTEYEE